MEREKTTAKIQELSEKINHLYEKIASQGEPIQELTNQKVPKEVENEKE